MRKIVHLNFKDYQKRAKVQNDVTLKLTPKAVDLIIEKGYDEKFGARELKRTVKKMFETKYATELLSGKIKDGSTVTVGARSEKLTFKLT